MLPKHRKKKTRQQKLAHLKHLSRIENAKKKRNARAEYYRNKIVARHPNQVKM